MSCEVKKIASFIDIDKCKNLLAKQKKESVPDDNAASENWLHDCQIALSPTGENLVIARGNQLILFTSKWDSTETGDVKMKYNITWHGNPCQQVGEEITAVLCVPLIPQGQSVNGGADWTCIVVGYSSGAIRFYTEAMNQLISETLHNELVVKIKCNSFKTPKQFTGGMTQESTENVYVLYKTVICTMNGFSLFQTLRGCRNQLARQRASSLGDALQTSIPIDFKKYGFSDQDAVTDACFVGQTSVNTFDHLVTASLVGGFYSNYRPSPPQTSLIVATGRKPFVGFHYTLEGAGNPILTDVAKAVATKIKNSVAATIPGWFGFGSKKSSQPDKAKEVAQEPAEQLGCRFGLCDLWRHGNSIVSSPDGKLSAVSDSLGRVMLIENANGIARRLWKGYREAQCGFLEVEEDVQKARHRKGKHSNPNLPPRHALFIVIYAPRKGLIEIFATQQGPRVASFKVTKKGRLLYVPHGLVGFSSAPVKGINTSQFPVIFVSDEGLMELMVPFHCALSDDTSKKARDLHVLKKIKAFLKQEDYSNSKLVEEMEKFAKELKTDEIRLQTIDMMMNNKHITTEAFKAVLNVFVEDLQTRDPIDNLGKNVLILSEELDKLLSFYQFAQDVNNLPPNYKTVVNPSEIDPSLPDVLVLPAKEIDFVLNFIKHIKSIEGNRKREIRVGFQEKETRDLLQFLNCFDFDLFVGTVQKSHDGSNVGGNITLCLKPDTSEEKLRTLGELFFKGMFYTDEWISDWKTHAKDCSLDEKDLMKCLLAYWLSKNQTENVSAEMISLVEVMKAICSLVDPCNISIEYNTPSPWWENIQKYISGSRFVLPGLLAALCCRAVTIITEQEKEFSKSQSGKKNPPVEADGETSDGIQGAAGASNEWENVSQDTWLWDNLITQLEDIALLNTILNLNFHTEKNNISKLPFDYELESLSSLLMKGNGRVSELAAKWLVQFGLNPSLLIDSDDVEFHADKTSNDKRNNRLSFGPREGISPEMGEAKEVRADVEGVILGHLTTLKSRFPYSLTSSSILCNMSWEFMAHWFRNVEDLESLHSAIEYLKAIPSVRLKYGISYLSWTTYLQQKFESVSKLLNRIGKVPKEKLCVQEINLTHLQVPVFLKLVTEFLNVMLESSFNKKSDFVTNREGIWENKLTANTPSLVSLALSQPMANDDLLLLHYQLAVSLHVIAALNIKIPNIFSSLFDSVARSELFTDMTKTSQISSHYSNASLKSSREQFLCKAVTGAVQTIELVEIIPPSSIANSPDYVPETKLSVDEATKWLRICFDLAAMWDVPLDNLRRHHICELYSCGFDRLAEEIIPAVNECSLLASQLLVVAGQRLEVYVHGSSDLSEKLSNLSPVLTTWFDSLNSENLKNHNIILNDIQVILAYVLKWLPEGHDDLKLALAMADSIPSLDNNNEL